MIGLRRTCIFAVGLLCFFPLRGWALDHVVLQLKWKHQFQFAGYYAAIEQGYYAAEGLEVELREAELHTNPVDEVLSGRADFGVSTSNLVLARAQGKPVVVLAVIYQHSPFGLLARSTPEIDDLHDLASRTIMMEPDAAELLAYFKNEGVDPSKLNIVPHDFDVADLITGKVGAMSAYSTDEPFYMKDAKVPYILFSPRAAGIDFYGDNLFTTETEIKNHAWRVRAFLKATLRGWEYAMKHQDEMIDLIQRKYNRGKSREQLRFEADETTRLVHPELIELGYVNPGRWENIAGTYADLGMIPRHFSLDGFVFDRNPKLDLRWLYWIGGGLIAIALLALGWAFPLFWLNRKLRREIQRRAFAEKTVREESEAKTRFIAMLAHEVRSPLSGILGLLWNFDALTSKEEKEQSLKIVQKSSENLLHMIDHLLDQSKLESGRVEIELLPISLLEFLNEICGLFQASASAKGLELKQEISEGTPSIIVTDPVRLRQILSNLISNAVKFTKTGSIVVSADVKPDQKSKVNVIFRIRDTGVGLSTEQAARIFEPYVQADASVTRLYGGTGLGLSISSQVAQVLGGDIRVESELGLGSTFIVTILAEEVSAK